jgi:hypothetical protein
MRIHRRQSVCQQGYKKVAAPSRLCARKRHGVDKGLCEVDHHTPRYRLLGLEPWLPVLEQFEIDRATTKERAGPPAVSTRLEPASRK